jgi:hypothetical protein
MLEEIFEESKAKKKKQTVRHFLMHRMFLKNLRSCNLIDLPSRKKKKKLKKFLNIHLDNTFTNNSENLHSKSNCSSPNPEADEQRGYFLALTVVRLQNLLHSITEASLTLLSTRRKACSRIYAPTESSMKSIRI